MRGVRTYGPPIRACASRPIGITRRPLASSWRNVSDASISVRVGVRLDVSVPGWVGTRFQSRTSCLSLSSASVRMDDRRGRLRGAAARQLPLGGEGDPGDREPSSGRRRGGARVDWATSSPRIRKRSAASRFAESERFRHKHGTGWSACFRVVKHFRKRLGLIRSSDQVGLAQYNVYEARTHFSRLIERAATGEEIVIARAGEPLVKLVPYRNEPRVPGVISAQIVFDAVRLPPGRL